MLKLFDATLLNSSEFHLHFHDCRHLFECYFFFGGYSTKIFSHEFWHVLNYLFSAQVARELRVI